MNSIVLLTCTLTVPLSLSISPSMAEIREDFPHPTVPNTATRLPFGTSTFKLEIQSDENNKYTITHLYEHYIRLKMSSYMC